MKTSENTILVTGGSTGIGLALAIRLLKEGNKVIICGRRQDKLDEAKRAYPELVTYRFDVAKESERNELFEKASRDFPKLNVLFNNAGIQRYPKLDTHEEPWSVTRQEIEINLEAPIHLSLLFAEHLKKQSNAAILMTTSGLSHVPLANAPVYSATKAGLHSFTLSLRHQLSKHSIEVIEVSPPAVDTDLGGPDLHTFGVDLNEFADAVMTGLKKSEQEITYGSSTKSANASRAERDAIFKMMNQ
ncbi:MAG: SDR family oxidoreductase [Bdellovibrionia bacterium]